MLEKADAWMIDKAEKFSHLTQHWLGIGAVTWERLFLCLCMVQFGTVELAGDWGKAWIVTDIFMMFWWIGRFVLSFYRRSNALGAEVARKVESDGNSYRAFGCLVGVFVLPFEIWKTFHPIPFHSQFWFQFWQLSLLFAACDDLPWGPSKARKFFDFALAALSQWKPTPEPVAEQG